MYNHWKKLLLALTAFFWNACDNNSSPTKSNDAPDSSSSSLTDVPVSSSSVSESSSSDGLSEAAPLYGILMQAICTRTEGDSVLTCSDGVTCVESVSETEKNSSCSETGLCAKYGVVIIKNKTYSCDDGMVYNESEFRALYETMTVAPNLDRE